MYKFHLTNCFIVFLFIFFVSGCSQSDDQREFERDAFNIPEGFTQTNGRGEIVDDNIDPDDWRIAPFFQGLISFNRYPHPNPVLTNDRITIEFFVTGVDAVSGIRVFAVHNINNLSFLYEDNRTPLPTGLHSISLNPLQIAQTPENPQGLYRIVIEDGNRNVITYGDVKIE